MKKLTNLVERARHLHFASMALVVSGSIGCRTTDETKKLAHAASAVSAAPPVVPPLGPGVDRDAHKTSAGSDAAAVVAPAREDLLTFAAGAIPLRIEGPGAALGAKLEEAVEAIDGNPTPYSLVNQAPAGTVTDLIYELPAETTFDRLGVPNVWETPSKYITFTQRVEVFGSSRSATEGFELLGSATLETQSKGAPMTELALTGKRPVRWVKVRLVGGIRVDAEKSTFQFSEIVGHGTQATPATLDRFKGAFRTRGAIFDLVQDGPVVSGCYDEQDVFSGTVTGNILRARSVDATTNVPSLFVLTVTKEGELRGVRSTNGAPFRVVTSAPAPAGAPTKCKALAPPKLGCGSIIHGIMFAFDSAEIRSDSAAVLARLFEGLRGEASKVVIEGHTSNEGEASYNLALSERRASAIVEDLVRRGIARSRITAIGRGEAVPIASNDDEAGRSLNRRVVVSCASP